VPLYHFHCQWRRPDESTRLVRCVDIFEPLDRKNLSRFITFYSVTIFPECKALIRMRSANARLSWHF
jgi:hypothetical protein